MTKNIGIKVLSMASGISPQTIRTWESRYEAFTPQRSDSGQRLYSSQDLRRARLISLLIQKGYAISKIAKLSEKELKNLVNSLNLSESPASRNVEEQVAISLKRLFTALNDFEIEQLALEIKHIRISVGVRDFIFEVVLPVMRRIGELVAKGTYSVTQEHIVSTMIRDNLSQITFPNLGVDKERVALATPDGNLHELSIMIASVLCRAHRLSTCMLGASHPPKDLALALNALEARNLILGAVSSDKWDYDSSMVPFLESMDEFLDHQIKVIIGGGGKINFPKFKNITEIEIINDFSNFDQGLADGSIKIF